MTALLAKALIESGLGEDLEPASGIETDLRYILFTAGMRGVKKQGRRDRSAHLGDNRKTYSRRYPSR